VRYSELISVFSYESRLCGFDFFGLFLSLVIRYPTRPVRSKSTEIASASSNDRISTPIALQPSFVRIIAICDATTLSTGDINIPENEPQIMSLKYHERLRLTAIAVTQQISMNTIGRIIATII